MHTARWRGHGFTLIELMIVVAIVGLLASIAVPNFVTMQLRTKRAELPMNLEGLRNAEKAYEHEWDAFTSCAISPATSPGKATTDFGHSYGDESSWDMLGWVADGKVRGQYQVAAAPGSDAVSRNFSAMAIGDMDADSRTAVFVSDRSAKPTMLTESNCF